MKPAHVLLVAAAVAAADLADPQFGPPSNLRIEGLLPEVAVISEPNPIFLFVPPRVPAPFRGVLQTGVRVTVVSASTGTAVWDSGQVATDATSVLYAGPALAPFSMYAWTVTVSLSGPNGSPSQSPR